MLIFSVFFESEMITKIICYLKNNWFVKNYSFLYQYCVEYRFRALISIFLTIPIGLLDTAVPAVLKYYIDGIMHKQMSHFVLYMPLLIIAFTLIQGVLVYCNNYLNAWVGSKVSNALKFDLYRKLLRCPANFFDTTSTGVIITRFATDADIACAGLLVNIKNFTKKFFNSVGYISVLLYMSWKLALVAIIVLSFALFPVKIVRQKIASLTQKQVNEIASLSSSYIESISGNRVIASYNLYEYLYRRFKNQLQNCFIIGIKMMQRTGILSPIMHFIVGFGIAIILFAGNYLLMHNQMTPGDFTAFITSAILLYQPIKTLGDDVTAVQNSIMAIERVRKVLQEHDSIVHGDILCPSDIQQIEYKNVNFMYKPNELVLRNINLTIYAGETVAFVGNSGGGKSTIVNLLPRFYDVTEGCVLINGKNIREYDLDSLRDRIAIVFQDNFLFDGSIRDNVTMGKTNATEEEIFAAIKLACLEEFINSLKNGLDTKVGERGVLLSGGQRQRIAIARAFIKNAPIVILDEATSALDNKSEAIVQQAINNLMKDRTVLIIAHRLSTITIADKIVVIDHGNIVEIGKHDELMGNPNGVYRSLYKMLS